MKAVEQLVQELKKLGVLKIDDLHWTEQDDVNNAIKQAQAMVEDEAHKAYLYGHEVGFMKAKEMEEKQMIDFALFRDDYLEKAEKLDDFTIPNEKLIKLFKHETK